MSSINLTQAKPFTLLEPIGTTETEISVKNLVDIYGEQIVMSGDIQYATLEPTSLENQEIISYTDIVIISSTVSKLTGVTRGCDAQPDPVTGLYSNSPTQAKAHAGNVTCILSDNPQVWDKKTSKDEDETITGNWTFTEQVIVPNPNLGQEAVNLDTLNAVVVSGAGDASTIAKGITRLSESPNLMIGTATITIATPAVVTFVSHGLTVNDTIQFTTTGSLPTGLLPSTTYYVISTGLTADAFQISATYSGTAIDTTGSQSGVHTLIKTTPVAVGVYDARLPTQSENDALAGTSGTPSGTNKYVTNDDTATAATADKVARRLAGGNITVVTESPGNNTTNAASTAFVTAAIPSTSYFLGSDTAATYYTTTIPLLYISSGTLAGWTASTLAVGSLNCAAGYSSLGSSGLAAWSILATLPGTGSNQVFTPAQTGKELRLKNSMRFTDVSDRIGFGIVVSAATIYTAQTDITDGTIRFIRNGGTLYAHNSNGTTATSTDVTGGRTLTDRHVYEIVYTPGTNILFYIDGTLVATHTTNMPTTGNLSVGMGANANGRVLETCHPILTIKQ